MSDADNYMYGPLYYDISWVLLGILLLLIVIAIVVLIFYITRKKEVKTLKSLKVTPLRRRFRLPRRYLNVDGFEED